jgi:translation elongation factor EF-Ts
MTPKQLEMVRSLASSTGCSLMTCKEALNLADFEVPLARRILEYRNLAVSKSFPIGRIIREYWAGAYSAVVQGGGTI